MTANSRIKDIIYLLINILIIIDLIMIGNLLFFDYSLKGFVWAFDVFVCLLLLLDFYSKLHASQDKKQYFKDHKFVFIGSIPLEFVSPIFILLRFVLISRLFKLLRKSDPFSRFFKNWNMFMENTKLDRIINWILFTVIVFTIALYFLDPQLNLFDSLWFVVVTLTTVGYGDVTPNTPFAKGISILLLMLGIFIFSTMTGAISSYFTDKVLNIDSDAEQALRVLDKKVNSLDSELSNINQQLEQSRKDNQKLQEKIDELLKK